MAELRPSIKWGLYTSSYIPLYFLLILKHWSYSLLIPDWSVIPEPLVGTSIPILSVFWGFLVLSALIPPFIIWVRKGRETDDIDVKSYNDGSDMLTTYILVYIFPFVVLNYDVLVNWVAFVVFWLVIGVIQVQSNSLYINPIFALPPFCYQIYEVNDGDRKLLLLSKSGLDRHDESISAIELSEDVYISFQ